MILALQVLTRLANYAAVLALVGTVTLRWGIANRQAGVAEHHALAKEFESALWSVGRISVVVLLVSVSLRVLIQTLAVFGVEEGFSFGFVKVIVSETPWGLGWLGQFVTALLAVATFSLTRRQRKLGWLLAAPVAVLCATAIPLTGHAVSAVSAPVGVSIQTIHVTAAGTWIGGLAILFVTEIRRPSSVPVRWRTDLIDRFSPMALGGVGALVTAGIISVFLYLDTWAQLFTTNYGRVLLAKIFLFAVAGLAGLYNWRVVRPGLRSADPLRAVALLQRTVRFELIGAMFALGATAVLVGLSMDL